MRVFPIFNSVHKWKMKESDNRMFQAFHSVCTLSFAASSVYYWKSYVSIVDKNSEMAHYSILLFSFCAQNWESGSGGQYRLLRFFE